MIGLHSFTTDDRFLRSRVGQFSFVADNAVDGSKAFWDVYTNQLGTQEEHPGTKLLALFLHGPGLLHNNVRKIETADDFQGLKVRTPGDYIADLMGDLGTTPMFMPSGEVYEKLSRGVVDGVTFPADGAAAFKLMDYIKATMAVPGGLYNTTWFIVMNEKKWNEISAEDQAVIEALSGSAFADLVGKAWDASDERSIKVLTDAGIEIHAPSNEVLATIKTAAASHEAAWIEAVAATGSDGAAALAAMRSAAGMGE